MEAGGTSVLASCLQLLAWTPEQLAREINRKCGPGTISPKAPYNWLKGALPRRRLPHIVATILSERLGEPITVGALWPDHFPATARQARPSIVPAQRGPAADPAPPEPPTPDLSLPDPLPAAVDWLLGDDAAPPTRSLGAEIPPEALEILTARIRQLRLLDDSSHGGLVMDWALQDLRWARKMATDYAYPVSTGIRLHRIIAELAQLAGWLAADLGLERRSRSCFLTALEAARTAGDHSLAAYVISCMSYRATWSGRGEEALRLIRIARKGSAGEEPGITQALLATRQARAHAGLGDEAGCRRALEEAAELSQAGGPPADAPWAYWLSPAVMVADAGRAWLEIGRPRQAEWHLQRGIELLGDSQPRNRLLHCASLAEARLGRGEVDGAAEAAGDALDLTDTVTSLRATARLSELRGRFLRFDSPAARRIVQRTDDLLRADRPQEEDSPRAAS
ncbi:hypothetical protein [Streptomyces griseocarneus]|uniref:hypothetical protein n=1 Tax=Streptomyces griseocarneus TaxID=51201 RepID=UPI00167DF0AC|nr:hypothetical protein [Streptomyces griseocarneus]MBZ6477592.1 hypothetical protein [Streptomyces griseocarneus]GHG83429.1 hypothetical protein GCM10018779_66580 [Streptomyces griseocarneus]